MRCEECGQDRPLTYRNRLINKRSVCGPCIRKLQDQADAAAAREARASIEAGEPLIPWERVKAEAGLEDERGDGPDEIPEQ